MKALAREPAYFSRERQFSLFEDFEHFVTGDVFTDTSADTGASVAMQDAANGQVLLVTGAVDNNECYLHTTKEVFLFAADKPLRVGCRIKFAEANTDDANVFFGLMDAVGADSILDDGAGPKATFDGSIIYKVDGETVWRVMSSNATARSSHVTAVTAGGTAWQKLEIVCRPISSTKMEILYFIDDSQLRSSTAMAGEPNIRHEYTLASSTEMMLFVGVKAGGANSESVYVDWIGGDQLR
jgi:hypothetical protein